MSARVMSKVISLGLLGLLLNSPAILAQEQEGEQDAPSYTREEYDAFKAATEEPDPAKREDTISEFVKQNSDSALVEYALGAFRQLLESYQKEGNWQALARAGEKFLELKPEDLGGLYFTMLGYYSLQDFRNAAEYGEQVYALKPDIPQLTYILAWSYRGLKESDKYQHYGEKALDEVDPISQLTILTELRSMEVERGNWAKAAEYSRKTTEALDKAERPAQTPEAEWKDYLSRERAVSHAVLGRQSFERENWAQAISNYQTAVRTYSRFAQLNAEAYYYIGMSYWKQGRIDPAMEAFARGANQKGGDPKLLKVSQNHLETLYRSTHNGSLAGLDEFVARVTRQ